MLIYAVAGPPAYVPALRRHSGLTALLVHTKSMMHSGKVSRSRDIDFKPQNKRYPSRKATLKRFDIMVSGHLADHVR